MRTLTVGASSLEVANRLYSALSQFHPEVIGNEDEGYAVTVALRAGDQWILRVLDAIERYVSERKDGPVRVEVDGHSVTVHPA
jgi:hypothetical protein